MTFIYRVIYSQLLSERPWRTIKPGGTPGVPAGADSGEPRRRSILRRLSSFYTQEKYVLFIHTYTKYEWPFVPLRMSCHYIGTTIVASVFSLEQGAGGNTTSSLVPGNTRRPPIMGIFTGFSRCGAVRWGLPHRTLPYDFAFNKTAPHRRILKN